MTGFDDASATLGVALLILAVSFTSTPAIASPGHPVPSLAGPAPGGPGTSGTGVAPAVDPGDYDLGSNSSATFWAGQRLYFNGTPAVGDPATASSGERSFQLREVAGDGEAGPLVREFVVDADGEVVLDTAPLLGEYVVVHDGDPVYVQDGRGYTASPPDGTSVTVENSAWEVAEQTLSVSWSDDRVDRDETVDLQVESNRAAFPIEVSADGLDFDDLETMFDSADYAPDHDARADDDVVVLAAGANAELPVSFDDIDDGEYTLSIEVADADVSTTADVRVGHTSTTTDEPATTRSPPATTSVASPGPTTDRPGITGVTDTDRPTADTPTEPTVGPTTETGTTAAPGQPGFGVVAGLIALLAAAAVGRRRLG